jgi:hypothetical protein
MVFFLQQKYSDDDINNQYTVMAENKIFVKLYSIYNCILDKTKQISYRSVIILNFMTVNQYAKYPYYKENKHSIILLFFIITSKCTIIS